MPAIRLSTFNCENLMMRWDSRRAGIANARQRLTEVDNVQVAEQVDSVFNVLSEDDRTLTAQAPATRIIRAGSPYHAARYTGLRFPGIGWMVPKASDHCPMAATLKFEGRALSA
jgi:hypothetical protein